MKKALVCGLLAVAVTCSAGSLYAQMTEGSGQGPGAPHRMPMTTDQRLQHLTKMLNLTEDQQQKIKPILENETQQMQSLHQDTSIPQQERWPKIQAVRDNTISQIKPILTEEQQKKYEEMTSHHAAPSGVMGQNPPPGAPPQAPPPQ